MANTVIFQSFEHDGKLIELIFKDGEMHFVYLDGNTFTLSKRVGNFKLDDVPVEIEKKAILLAEKADSFGNLKSLVIEIVQHIRKYVDVDKSFVWISAFYILLSWVYDKFSTIPIVRVIGNLGTGKSRFLIVVGNLCYKRLAVTGGTTLSPIFRLCDKWRGTLVLDEGDLRYSDKTAEFTKFLNCRYSKEFRLLRANKNDPSIIEIFEIYGPTLIGTRGFFADAALESRCITTVMEETVNPNIPKSLPCDYENEKNALINKLLTFRLNNYKQPTGNINDLQKYLVGIDNRLVQIFLPLLAIADKNGRKFIAYYAKDCQSKLNDDRALSDEGLTFSIYLTILNGRTQGNRDVEISLVTYNFNQKYHQKRFPRWIGNVIRSLKLKTKRTASGYVVIYDKPMVDKLKWKFGCS